VGLKTLLKRAVPPRVLLVARSYTYRGLDVWDGLRGMRDPMIPPKHLMYDAPARDTRTFRENSREFLRYYIELCGLRPDESVLDVGSGVGRKTIALTQYLDGRGRYEGLEIIRKAVEWCTSAIGSRYPNFRFTHIDVFNGFYNPGGKARPVECVFPFETATFDLVVLASVFTHMQPADVAHYFSEIRRVLKTGGRCLITYFLLNEESKRLMAEGRSTLEFVHDFGDFLSTSRSTPEVAICLPESMVRQLYATNRLEIAEPVRYGSWCGRRDFLSYQDIVIAYLASQPPAADRG
jgi:SAM-dependent methyltransferase